MVATDDRKKNRQIALIVCVAAVLLLVVAASLPNIAVFQQRPADHLSIHLILEMFSITVSVMVVSIAWSTFGRNDQVMGKVLVFGFSVVAGVDMLHALVYQGMPSLIIDGSTAEAIFFWLSGRSFEVLTVLLVAARVSLPGKCSTWLWLALVTIAVLFIVGTYFLEALPVLFVPGEGVTPFKVYFEYGLCLSNLLLAGWLFFQSRNESQPRNIWIATACFVLGVGELAFTNYVATADFLNIFGHLYKIAAYALIYRATFLSSVREPYERLEHTEHEVRAQGARLETLLNNLPVGIVRFDRDLQFSYVNPIAAASLQMPLGQILGKNAFKVMSPSLCQQIAGPINEALAGGRSELELAYSTTADTEAFAYAIVVPERYSDSNDTGALAILTDTTERERERRALSASLREVSELKSALDAHAIVAVTDARGVITRVNDKFCSISQYPRSELIGRTHRIINSGYHPKAFFQDLWRTISRGKVWNGEICNKSKDGSFYWVYTTIVPFIGADGVPEQYVAIRADITTRKQAEQEAERMAFHDALTGLPNRRLMYERLKHAIDYAVREHTFGAVLMLDLDEFKEINDTLGHAVGDELLCQASRRLIEGVRHSDAVARLGGDEFVVVLENIGSNLEMATAMASDLAEKVRESLCCPYSLHGQQVVSTPSIGVVLFDSVGETADELIKQADMALYKAKHLGRNRVCFFDASLQLDINARALLLRDLRQALDNRELRLYYQPVVDEQQTILGVEALLRWQHPLRGLVSPAEFIPLAEQANLILPIGQWALEVACAQLRDWADDPLRQRWTIAVNVSAKQFNEPEFVATVERVLMSSGARPERLRLEVTESMLQGDLNSTILKMDSLRKQGVRFALDDFGTGYSSLSYLKRLPLDQLKIDKSFVNDVLTDENDAAIARTIIALAGQLGLSVVAEGVETQEQLAFLIEHGCQAFQGYLFSRPVSVQDL